MDVSSDLSETLFKFILVGDAGRHKIKLHFINFQGVGKTSILLRYTKNEFINDYQVTVGAEFGSRVINIDGGHKVKLQIWDTVIIRL